MLLLAAAVAAGLMLLEVVMVACWWPCCLWVLLAAHRGPLLRAQLTPQTCRHVAGCVPNRVLRAAVVRVLLVV